MGRELEVRNGRVVDREVEPSEETAEETDTEGG